MTARTKSVGGLLFAAAVAICLVAASVVFDESESITPVAPQSGGDADIPGLVLAYPESGGASDRSLYVAELPELIDQSDVVVVGEVAKQLEYTRADTGIKGVEGVLATYSVEVEQYLKGDGASTLDVRKVVAYENSGEALGLDTGFAYFIDDAHPISVPGRYILALRLTDDGWFGPTAEVFRFKVDGGSIRVESTVDGLEDDAYVKSQFPAKSEEDLIVEIESLVSTQAAEEPAR